MWLNGEFDFKNQLAPPWGRPLFFPPHSKPLFVKACGTQWLVPMQPVSLLLSHYQWVKDAEVKRNSGPSPPFAIVALSHVRLCQGCIRVRKKTHTYSHSVPVPKWNWQAHWSNCSLHYCFWQEMLLLTNKDSIRLWGEQFGLGQRTVLVFSLSSSLSPFASKSISFPSLYLSSTRSICWLVSPPYLCLSFSLFLCATCPHTGHSPMFSSANSRNPITVNQWMWLSAWLVWSGVMLISSQWIELARVIKQHIMACLWFPVVKVNG